MPNIDHAIARGTTDILFNLANRAGTRYLHDTGTIAARIHLGDLV